MSISRSPYPALNPEQLLKMYHDACKARLEDKKMDKIKSLLRTGAEHGHTLSIMELGHSYCEITKEEDAKEIEEGQPIERTFSEKEKIQICNWLKQEEKKDNINASLLIARIEEDENAEKAIIQSVLDPLINSKIDKIYANEVYIALADKELLEMVPPVLNHNGVVNPNPIPNLNPAPLPVVNQPALNVVANPNNNPNLPANLNPNPIANVNQNNAIDEKARRFNQISTYNRLAFESSKLAAREGDIRALMYLCSAYHEGKGTNKNELESIQYFMKYKKALGVIPDRSEYYQPSSYYYLETIKGGTQADLEFFRLMMHWNYPLYEDMKQPEYVSFPKPIIVDPISNQDLYGYLINQNWIQFNPNLFRQYLIELAKQGFTHMAFPILPGCEQTAENSEMFIVHTQFKDKTTYDVGITKIINDYAGFNMARGNNLLFWKSYSPQFPKVETKPATVLQLK